MDFSADPAVRLLPRVAGVCRLLMQVRLLLAGLTALFLVRTPITLESALALAAVVLSSWLVAHHWDRIAPKLLRYPSLIGLDVVVSAIVLQLGGPLGSFFLFTVVTAGLAGLLYRWRGLVFVSALQILCYYGALATHLQDPEIVTFQAVVGQPFYYPLMGFVGMGVRRLLDQQAAAEEARNVAEVAAAAADERARLAREMHDSLAKTLRGIALSASSLAQWIRRNPDRAAEEAQRLASAAEIASFEARDLIADLRIDNLQQPIADVVRGVAEEWSENTGIPARLNDIADVELPLLPRYEAIAILKESLTNVARHAEADSVEIQLRREPGDLATLVIGDDGTGFASEGDPRAWLRHGRYGLVGMYERATRAGGTFSIDSTPGRATTVTATFPIDPISVVPDQRTEVPADERGLPPTSEHVEAG